MYRALIVEDDEDLAAITKAQLTRGGYHSDVAHTGRDALYLLERQSYDLILLDEVLPDERGDSLCSAIRGHSTSPIIFMSGLDDSETIIAALKNGGDDYMIKPVDFGELLARVDAIVRRRGGGGRGRSLRRFRQFSIDTSRRRILRNGEEMELSAIEYGLLSYMTDRPDTLLSYSELYQSVWDSDSLGDIRTVMVHISNLRKKIDPNRTGVIQTVRGSGYLFSDV